MSAPPGPVFIGGSDRSGKTLMRWVLSGLPRILISRRTAMWPRFYGRFGDLERPENLTRCLEAMTAREQIAALAPDIERIRRELTPGGRTYPRLFALIHEHHAERSGRSRWGDQTPLVERYATHVMDAYPGARFIHMIRDPRDCHSAVLDRETRRTGTVGRVTARWVTSASLATKNPRCFPGAYLVVRYEDLVTDPAGTVETVCGFLDEDFDPALLLLERARRYESDRAEARGASPISARDVGRFRDRLDPGEIAFIQRVAARWMKAFGYEPQTVALSARQRLRGTAAWPRALARFGARLMIDRPSTRPVS